MLSGLILFIYRAISGLRRTGISLVHHTVSWSNQHLGDVWQSAATENMRASRWTTFWTLICDRNFSVVDGNPRRRQPMRGQNDQWRLLLCVFVCLPFFCALNGNQLELGPYINTKLGRYRVHGSLRIQWPEVKRSKVKVTWQWTALVVWVSMDVDRTA